MKPITAICHKVIIPALIVAAFLGTACRAPYPNALVSPDGDEIRLTLINSILQDPDLNADEKKQALRDAGITDEAILNLFTQ